MSRDTFGLQREELDVMVAENRAYGDAGVFESGAQISYRNDKKVNQVLKVCLKWIRNLGEPEILVYSYEIMFILWIVLRYLF